MAAESENYGAEQEHLNNVFGAHIRITSLRSAGGPGIELLEYLAPRDGRLMPADSHTEDVWAWQTTLVARDAKAAVRTLLLRGADAVSSRPIALLIPDFGFTRAFLLRDPDGHLIRILEQGKEPTPN